METIFGNACTQGDGFSQIVQMLLLPLNSLVQLIFLLCHPGPSARESHENYPARFFNNLGWVFDPETRKPQIMLKVREIGS